jgi:hypothetical protein
MLAKRERYIAIIAGVVLGILVLDWYVLTPLVEQRNLLATRRQNLEREVENALKLFETSKQMTRKWGEMRSGGMKQDASDAESQLLNTVRGWSSEAGLTLSAIRPERVGKSHDLQEIGFQAAGNANLRAAANLLYRLETTSQPIRIRELQITSRSDGSDDLSVQLRLSTLCPMPETGRGAAAGAGARQGGEP